MRPILAENRHDAQSVRDQARDLRDEADTRTRHAVLVKGASWAGTAATLGLMGRFFVNRVLPIPFETDVGRRQAVLRGLGMVSAMAFLQSKLLANLNKESDRMLVEANRVAAMADDAEREVCNFARSPADQGDEGMPDRRA